MLFSLPMSFISIKGHIDKDFYSINLTEAYQATNLLTHLVHIAQITIIMVMIFSEVLKIHVIILIYHY